MFYLRGIEFQLHETVELLSERIRSDKDFYEHEILDYLAENYPEQGEILDVGANIGNHTVYFANFLKYSKIIALEPIKENFKLLSLNIDPYREVYAYRLAASDYPHILKMHPDKFNMGASRVTEDGSEEVIATTIDSLWLPKLTLLKIDAESHEPQILAGAVKTIQRTHPLILIEDTEGTYKKLLPISYNLIKQWEKYKTYLYEWSGRKPEAS